MMSEDSKNEDLEKKVISFFSSVGGVSPSKCLSTMNTSLETVLERIEAGFLFESLAMDVRELCIEVNRLADYIESSGVCCSAETYRLLLTTLSRLRTAVTQVQGYSNKRREQTVASFHAYRIQTPRLPDDLSLTFPCSL
ncbi:hypothetical protein TcYC6_0017470 [Trypanosoma cruzi]|nr:hypothetical protein TcYC6_0017470 [Trypanosoma cruzi]